MGNNLNADIAGRFVLLREDWFKKALHPVSVTERVFLAEGGFGCSAEAMGNAVVGEFVVDGERCRVEGYNLDSRFATETEIEEALEERDRRDIGPTKALDAAMERLIEGRE